MKKLFFVLIFVFLTAQPVFGAAPITVADLGIKSVGLLPTNPFYFVKEWRRDLSRFLTFNPIKKAELELRIVNEKAAEILKVNETMPDNAKALAGALEKYGEAQSRLRQQINSLKETSKNPNIDRLIEGIVERSIRHEVLFDDLREKFAEQTKKAAEKIRQDEIIVCIDIYEPVCGTDNQTYSNDCYAKAAGVSVSYGGECEPLRSNY